MKAVLSILSIAILLVGTTGINFDTHYCGGKEIKSSVSFMPKKLSCGMSMAKKACDDDGSEKFSRVCCSNDHTSFQIDNDYLKFNAQALTVSAAAIIPNSLNAPHSVERKENKYEFLGYSPPPIQKDIIILVQSFLI